MLVCVVRGDGKPKCDELFPRLSSPRRVWVSALCVKGLVNRSFSNVDAWCGRGFDDDVDGCRGRLLVHRGKVSGDGGGRRQPGNTRAHQPTSALLVMSYVRADSSRSCVRRMAWPPSAAHHRSGSRPARFRCSCLCARAYHGRGRMPFGQGETAGRVSFPPEGCRRFVIVIGFRWRAYASGQVTVMASGSPGTSPWGCCDVGGVRLP